MVSRGCDPLLPYITATEALGLIGIVHLEFREPPLLDISLNETFVDFVAEGFDAGIRLGEAIDKDMVAVRLTPANRSAIAASLAYPEAAGRLRTLEDLPGHKAIHFRFPGSGTLHVWEFEQEGKPVRARMPQQLIVDDRMTAIRLAVQSFGLTFVNELEVASEVRSGAL